MPGVLAIMPAIRPAEFVRGGVTDRIGDIQGGGASLNGDCQDFVKELWIRASGIFRAEFYIFAQGAGISHLLGDGGQHLAAAHAQLVLQVDI